ncbi:hypothetical protein [Marinibactrum halimedae]|nr:hypothetical protein [Marinibactrum halimedae]
MAHGDSLGVVVVLILTDCFVFTVTPNAKCGYVFGDIQLQIPKFR